MSMLVRRGVSALLLRVRFPLVEFGTKTVEVFRGADACIGSLFF